MYDYITLTQTNIDGSISPFANGASGLILLGTGTSTPPAWTSLADAGIASLTDLEGYLPLTGGTLTGALTGTSASFSSGVTATGGFTGDLTGTASNAAKVANALSIQLGTNTAQTYDGSAAKSFVITPSAIGAKPDFSWPSAGLMTSTGTTPSSIAWPDTSATGFHLLVTHTGAGAHAGSWKKFSNAGSSDVGILSWQGSGENLNFSLINTSEIGNVLARTSNGYEFVPLGQTTVPPITGLQSGTNSTTSKILLGGADAGSSPTWVSLTDVPTGLSAGVAKIDSNGKLTSGAVSLTGSEVAGTLPVSKGGTGLAQLGTANQVLTSDGSQMVWANKANAAVTADKVAHRLGFTVNNSGVISTVYFDGSADIDGSNLLPIQKSHSTGILAGQDTAWTRSIVPSNDNQVLVSVTSGDTWDFEFRALSTVLPAITGLASNSTDSGYLLTVGSEASGYAPTWIQTLPVANGGTGLNSLGTSNAGRVLTVNSNGDGFTFSNYITSKAFTFPTSNTWYRIAYTNNNANGAAEPTFFRAIRGNTSSALFAISLTNRQDTGIYPQIRDILYSDADGFHGVSSIRIVYKGNSTCYLEVKVKGNNDVVDFDNIIPNTGYRYWIFNSDLETGNVEEGYSTFTYNLTRNNCIGTPGQVLTTTGNADNPNGKGTGISWTTLPTIPSAPSSLPLVDNETGALGTTGTYANADHQHPLPYAVQAAYKFYYPKKIGIGGAITAEAQEYDGTSDLILQVTEIDPAAIINTVPIEKGGTGATTAAAALTNLGAAAANHNHDSTYLKLSGGTMGGTITFNSAVTTAIVIPGLTAGIAEIGSNGALSTIQSANSFVTGRRNNINLYDADVSDTASTPTDINHIAKNDTTVNIVCGSSATRAYTRYVNLPTPTADMLGDTITIYFTNQKAAVTGTLWATCSTDERIMDYRYEHFKNAETAGWSNCKWANGNIVQFTCIKLDSTGTTYYWRAVKLVEQSW